MLPPSWPRPRPRPSPACAHCPRHSGEAEGLKCGVETRIGGPAGTCDLSNELPTGACLACSKPTVDQKFLALRRSVRAQRRASSALQATSSMEVAQLAGEAGYIFGVASVMFGMTLVVSAYVQQDGSRSVVGGVALRRG